MGVLRSRAVDGRANFGVPLEEYARPNGLLGKLARRAGVRLRGLDSVSESAPLTPMLHRDRWVVRCPDCGDASFVWTETPLFMCAYCFNVKAKGLWRRVAFPKNREAIEEMVGLRPFAHQRCWTGETLRELRRENVRHGHPVPVRS